MKVPSIVPVPPTTAFKDQSSISKIPSSQPLSSPSASHATPGPRVQTPTPTKEPSADIGKLTSIGVRKETDGLLSRIEGYIKFTRL